MLPLIVLLPVFVPSRTIIPGRLALVFAVMAPVRLRVADEDAALLVKP